MSTLSARRRPQPSEWQTNLDYQDQKISLASNQVVRYQKSWTQPKVYTNPWASTYSITYSSADMIPSLKFCEPQITKLSPTDPRCPNYKYRFDTATDPLSLDYVQAYLQTKATLETDETRESNRLFTENAATQKSPKPNNASANRILTQQAQQQAQSLLALNNIPGFASYSQQIPGGVYPELIKYPSKVLPDAKSSRLLSASQERLHNRLVDLQYSPRSP